MIDPPSTQKLSKYLQLAQKAALEAGEKIMELYGEVKAQKKADDSPVTKADLLSNQTIIEILTTDSDFPILSEESADDSNRLQKDAVWVIDPLDGTKDFIQQTDEFSLMIGLVYQGKSVVGVVYNPAKGDLYYASDTQGAWFKSANQPPQPISVSKQKDFQNFRMLVSRNHLLELEQNVASNLGIKNLIPCGSAGYKTALIARGQAEVYMNTSDKTWEWDICAADIIIKEAGGAISDMKGQEIIYNKKNPRNIHGFVISSGKGHEKIISALNAKGI